MHKATVAQELKWVVQWPKDGSISVSAPKFLPLRLAVPHMLAIGVWMCVMGVQSVYHLPLWHCLKSERVGTWKSVNGFLSTGMSVSGFYTLSWHCDSSWSEKRVADSKANPTGSRMGLRWGFCSPSISLAEVVTSRLIGLINRLPDRKIPQISGTDAAFSSLQCLFLTAARRAAAWTMTDPAKSSTAAFVSREKKIKLGF